MVIKMYELECSIALREDAENIMELYRTMVGKEGCTWSEDYPSMEILLRDIKKKNEFCMKDNNGNIVAAIAIDEDEAVGNLNVWSGKYKNAGELSRLAVREDCQNHGIAKEIIRYVREEMKKRGYDGIHFLASKTNPAALACYKKMDVEVVGETFLYDTDWWCYEGKAEQSI